LRPDENVEVAGEDRAQHARPGLPPARGIRIDPRHSGRGKQLRDRRLQPLRAEAERQQILIAAQRARDRQGFLVRAVVAPQPLLGEVHDQPRAAAVAGRGPGAGNAQHRGGKAPAVDEQQRLFPALEICGQRLDQRLGEPGRRGAAALRSEPDDRQFPSARAIGET
jgi:hypothetical protein